MLRGMHYDHRGQTGNRLLSSLCSTYEPLTASRKFCQLITRLRRSERALLSCDHLQECRRFGGCSDEQAVRLRCLRSLCNKVHFGAMQGSQYQVCSIACCMLQGARKGRLCNRSRLSLCLGALLLSCTNVNLEKDSVGIRRLQQSSCVCILRLALPSRRKAALQA